MDVEQTVRSARADFFAASDFAPDGGYTEPWQEADFGPVRYRVPNTAARAAALRRHDLHHVATGYPATWRGEAEISGWELGSGAGSYPYAWLIALFGLFTGLMRHPGPTIRAFLRGRHSTNLYRPGPSTAALLDEPVSALRGRLSVLPAEADPWAGRALSGRIADVALLAMWSVLSLLLGALSVLPAAALIALAWRPQLPALTCPFSCAQGAAAG